METLLYPLFIVQTLIVSKNERKERRVGGEVI